MPNALADPFLREFNHRMAVEVGLDTLLRDEEEYANNPVDVRVLSREINGGIDKVFKVEPGTQAAVDWLAARRAEYLFEDTLDLRALDLVAGGVWGERKEK